MVIIILFTAYTIHRIAFFNRLTCWLLVMLVFYKTERSREFPRGRGGGGLQISSDRDDRVAAKIKTQEDPWTNI